jgi:hypothetical protein
VFAEKMWKLRVKNDMVHCIFTMVFHRILDFKSGAGFLSSPFIFALSPPSSVGKSASRTNFALRRYFNEVVVHCFLLSRATEQIFIAYTSLVK